MLHLRFLVFLSALTISYNSVGQQCSLVVKGRVDDVHHEHGLEYATVYIEETGQGAQCDESGAFEIKEVCRGKYHFQVSHLGCESKSFYVSVNRDTTLVFSLEHHSQMLSEVVVSENRSRTGIGLQHYTVAEAILNRQQGKDLASIASTIPGVSVLRTGNSLGKPIIHGLYGTRVQLLNQGIPQEGQQWGIDHAPEIDASTAQKISVIKGSAAVKYGVAAMAGVVLLEAAPIKADPHVHGHVNLSYLTNGRVAQQQFLLENTTSFARMRLTGSTSYGGDQKTASYYLTNTGNRQAAASLLMTNDAGSSFYRSLYGSFYYSETGILRGAHVGNSTDLEAAIQREIPFYTADTFSYHIHAPRQRVQHWLLKSEIKKQVSDRLRLGLDAAFQVNKRQEYDVRRGGRDSLPALDLALYNIWADAYIQFEKTEHSRFTLGLQPRFNNNSNTAGTGIYPLIPNYTLFNPALYASWLMKWKAFDWEAGARIEMYDLRASYIDRLGVQYQPHRNSINQAYSFGFSREMGPQWQVKSNLSLLIRAAQVHELYSNGLHQGLAALELGNAQLGNEKSLKWSNDVRFQPGEESQLSLSLYWHYIRDYIYLAPTLENRLTIRGAFPVFAYRQDDVSLRGFDFLWHQGIDHSWEINTKAAYVKGSYTDGSGDLIYMPPLRLGTEVAKTFEPFSGIKDLRTALEIQYTARASTQTQITDYAAPPPSWYMVNLSVGAKYEKKGFKTAFQISVDNVLNTRYRDYLNRLRYFADDLGRNVKMSIKLIF